MSQCILLGQGANIKKTYIYLEGVPFEIMKGSFPGVSENALPLTGSKPQYQFGSTTSASDTTYTTDFKINGVEMFWAQCGGGNTNWGNVRAKVNFIDAYGLSIDKLSKANTSGVTVIYWLKRVE